MKVRPLVPQEVDALKLLQRLKAERIAGKTTSVIGYISEIEAAVDLACLTIEKLRAAVRDRERERDGKQCIVTKNLFGTDTWAANSSCKCTACQLGIVRAERDELQRQLRSTREVLELRNQQNVEAGMGCYRITRERDELQRQLAECRYRLQTWDDTHVEQLELARKATAHLVAAGTKLLQEYNLAHVREDRCGYWLDLSRALDAAKEHK